MKAFSKVQKNNIVRKYEFCTTSNAVKPFDSIPGPKSLPLIGTLWAYFPVIGKYHFDRMHRTGFLKLKQYGPLVREDIVPGIPTVWVFRPEDIETVYRCEGRYPQRRSHLALEKYRLDRPDIYNSGGLLPTNGPEWSRIRKTFQQDLNKLQNIRLYVSNSDAIIKRFFSLCVRDKPKDLLPSLSRLFLELTGLVTFDESLDSFSPIELKPDSRTSKLIEAAATINGLLMRMDNGLQLWKMFNTPAYRKLSEAHFYIESVAKEFLQKKLNHISKTQDTTYSLLHQYLKNPKLDVKDILGMTVDMLLAGIDTIAYSSSFVLYHISTNEDKQKIMFSELRELLPLEGTLTENILLKCVYTKAVIKEAFRMNPVSVGVGRILAEDAILYNYHVPAGTVVVTQNQVTCRLPEYFSKPDTFIPERWLRENQTKPVHPFLVLPFGHGPRSCIARRLAEQNMQLLIINAVRNYKLSWLGEDLDCRSIQINKPDKDVLIRFEKRTM